MTRIVFATKVSLGTFILGVVLLLIVGPWLLSMINGNTTILPFNQLLFLATVLFLEVNHNNFASVISTKNEIPYMWPYLLAGFFIILLSILFTSITSFGIWSSLLAQGVVQLSYNNWKWPMVVWKELKNI